jgi:hypothetical protein
MQQETWRYPCELSYYIEHQTQVVLKSEFGESLNYALDRFLADETRFDMGLMAVLATRDSGELYVGWNATRSASCLGYADQEEVERSRPSMAHKKLWAKGGAVNASDVQFHWFVPDCPSVFPKEFLLPFPIVRKVVLAFMESGEWPEYVEWVPNRGRG